MENCTIKKTQVYEIKKGRNWEKVRATSINALSRWAKENNINDWRMMGMMSISEIIKSKDLIIVA